MPAFPIRTAPVARAPKAVAIAALALLGALAGCSRENELVVDSGVGVLASRSACPATGIPDHTGDVTLFDPPSSRDAAAIDVTAVITDLRARCTEQGATIEAAADFRVIATRRDAAGPRRVVLPYFSTVTRGGTAVVAKRVGGVAIDFADGALRAETTGVAYASIDRAAATLPDDIRDRITRRRRSGEEEAAVDPLSEPEVRTAVSRASFELLVGFQLTPDQLQYNATR